MIIFFIPNIQYDSYVRRNFPNFLFSRVLEMFGCWSLEIFQKKTEFLNSRNFCLFFGYFWILTKIVRQFQKFQKNYVKFEFLSQKTLFLGLKVWKSSEKVKKSLETGFSECSEISEIVLFRTFRKLRKNDV